MRGILIAQFSWRLKQAEQSTYRNISITAYAVVDVDTPIESKQKLYKKDE